MGVGSHGRPFTGGRRSMGAWRCRGPDGCGNWKWAYENGVQLHLITPGRPMENGYIESFNGKSGMSVGTRIGSWI